MKWPAGASFQLEFDEAYLIPGTRIDLGIKDDITWGLMEVSADGETWHTVPLTRDTRDRWNGKWETSPVKYLRFTNTGQTEQHYLREFYVVFNK